MISNVATLFPYLPIPLPRNFSLSKHMELLMTSNVPTLFPYLPIPLSPSHFLELFHLRGPSQLA